MRKIITIVCSFVLLLCISKYIDLGKIETLPNWQAVEIQSKFRARQGVYYIVFNNQEYALSAGGSSSRAFYLKVSEGDFVKVLITNSNQIAALRYKDEEIYSNSEFVQGIEYSRMIFGVTIVFLSLILLIIILSIKRSS